MSVTITPPASNQAKPRNQSEPGKAAVSATQQRFLSVALNGSKVEEPAGVLAGS